MTDSLLHNPQTHPSRNVLVYLIFKDVATFRCEPLLEKPCIEIRVHTSIVLSLGLSRYALKRNNTQTYDTC